MKSETKEFDYLHQFRSKYNRQSGDKTLLLVGALIFFVVVLSVVMILII